MVSERLLAKVLLGDRAWFGVFPFHHRLSLC